MHKVPFKDEIDKRIHMSTQSAQMVCRLFVAVAVLIVPISAEAQSALNSNQILRCSQMPKSLTSLSDGQRTNLILSIIQAGDWANLLAVQNGLPIFNNNDYQEDVLPAAIANSQPGDPRPPQTLGDFILQESADFCNVDPDDSIVMHDMITINSIRISANFPQIPGIPLLDHEGNEAGGLDVHLNSQGAPTIGPDLIEPLKSPLAASPTAGIPIYGAQAHDIIQSNQKVPAEVKNSGTTVIEITVAPDGQILSSNIEKSSGNPLIDSTALSHAQTANLPPFNPLMPQAPEKFIMPVEIDPGDND